MTLMSEGQWEIPLGAVALDRELAIALRDVCPLVRHEPAAHGREYSLGMELPFLQMLGEMFHIVPLVLGFVPYEVCQELGHGWRKL